MSIEKRSIALLSLRASEFNNVHSVIHKSGTKYLRSFVVGDEISGTRLVLSKHEI